MNGLKDIICTTKPEEAEEMKVPGAIAVEATDFQSVGAGSIPVGDTKGMKDKNWNFGVMVDTIGGRDFARLSVLH